MSAALADFRRWRYDVDKMEQKPQAKVPAWLTWTCESAMISVGASHGHDVAEYLVDYGPLSTLQAARIQTIKAAGIDAFPGKLSDNVVLVGRGTWLATPDVWVIPGHNTPIPGVFLHACGVATLLNAPLFELSPLGRLVIDATLSMVILGSISIFRTYNHFRYPGVPLATHRLQHALTYTVATVACLFGVVFVQWTRLMWDDFLFVTIALFAHSKVERCTAWLYSFTRKQWRGLFLVDGNAGDEYEKSHH
jgi:CHASE2 domain-containing sensor protein